MDISRLKYEEYFSLMEIYTILEKIDPDWKWHTEIMNISYFPDFVEVVRKSIGVPLDERVFEKKSKKDGAKIMNKLVIFLSMLLEAHILVYGFDANYDTFRIDLETENIYLWHPFGFIKINTMENSLLPISGFKRYNKMIPMEYYFTHYDDIDFNRLKMIYNQSVNFKYSDELHERARRDFSTKDELQDNSYYTQACLSYPTMALVNGFINYLEFCGVSFKTIKKIREVTFDPVPSERPDIVHLINETFEGFLKNIDDIV